MVDRVCTTLSPLDSASSISFVREIFRRVEDDGSLKNSLHFCLRSVQSDDLESMPLVLPSENVSTRFLVDTTVCYLVMELLLLKRCVTL